MIEGSVEGDVLAGDVVEVHLLREKLADKPVHIFVGAALQRDVGVSWVTGTTFNSG
jgi:hypothetical protein